MISVKGDNVMALEHSKKKSIGQRFLVCNMEGVKCPCVYRRTKLHGSGIHKMVKNDNDPETFLEF